MCGGVLCFELNIPKVCEKVGTYRFYGDNNREMMQGMSGRRGNFAVENLRN